MRDGYAWRGYPVLYKGLARLNRFRFRKSMIVAGLLLIAAVLPLAAGSGLIRQNDAYYYGEDGRVPKTPVVSGTFIQPGLCEDWTDSQWDRHLDMLLRAGIDTVVLQWTAETPNGEFSSAYFPVPAEWKRSASGIDVHGEAVERLLKSAEKKNVKVFLGLNLADEWWDNAFRDGLWCREQADAGNETARELYGLYKQKYPHAFHGWYWAWEMYGNPFGYERKWSDFMNINLDYLSVMDASMPVLFSPFLSSYIRLSPGQEETFWKRFLQSAHLRPGDIFCPQDSVGAAGFTMEYADGHLSAMKQAAGTVPGLLFWVNNENFTKDFKPATLDRFVSQLYISGRYTDTHLCFSYSHYYDPLAVDPSFDRDYRAFASGGKVETALPAKPSLTARVSEENNEITLTVTVEGSADIHTVQIYRGRRLVDTHEVTGLASGPFQYTKTFAWNRNDHSAYYATVSNCWGKVSEPASPN